jgi:hypothetical protein
MKATNSFKLSKPAKTMLCRYTDTHRRGEVKKLMIGAEIASQVRISRREKEDKSGGEA